MEEKEFKVCEGKSFFLVKYKDISEAQKAYHFLKNNKESLGDPRCEVAMILNPEKVLEIST
jgi:hypothetical protein